MAQAFAREGARLVLIARTQGALESLDDEIRAGGNDPASLLVMSLADLEALDKLGPMLYERFGQLDVLVGNAGYLADPTPLHQLPAEKWEESFMVNLFANFRLIRTLHPLLKRSPAGRAIFVTSGVVGHTPAYLAAYGASKAALEEMVRSYAAECRPTSVRANLIDPGIVRTRMRAKFMPGEDPESLPLPETLTDGFVELALSNCPKNGEIIRL